jgi:polyphenol oxidase
MPISSSSGTGAVLAFHGDPPTHLTFEALSAAGLRHALTTRHCPGIAAFRAGPDPPAALFGATALAALAPARLDLTRTAFVRQVHGTDVARAAAGGFAGTADVIVTTIRALPVAVSTADCLALVLHDPDRHVLAVAHAGWRGTVKGIAAVAAEALASAGGSAARAHVAISPSIGPCCYEVDQAVVDPLRAAFPAADTWLTPRGSGRWMLDLWAANEAQLVATGVAPPRIYNPRLCTACRPDLFFSYRRRDLGRLVTVAALPGVGPAERAGAAC